MDASQRVSMIPKSFLSSQTLRLKFHERPPSMFFPNIKVTGTQGGFSCNLEFSSFSSPRTSSRRLHLKSNFWNFPSAIFPITVHVTTLSPNFPSGAHNSIDGQLKHGSFSFLNYNIAGNSSRAFCMARACIQNARASIKAIPPFCSAQLFCA